MKQSHKNNISRGLQWHHAKKRLLKKVRLIITTLQIFALILVVVFSIKAFNEIPEIFAVHYVKAQEPVEVKIYKIEKGNEYAHLMAQISEEYGVDYDLMQYLVNCESSFDTNRQSHFIQKYGREESYGLSQIHLKAHPEITKEQAKDPRFALEFMAKNIKAGNTDWMWVNCYKNYLGQK